MKNLLFLITTAVLMFSCNKVTELPQVITSNAVITDTMVTLSGEVTFTGDDDNTTRGFCWSESQSPTTADEVWIDNSTGLGLFNVSIDVRALLKPNTTYYCKTFAENEAGKSYGNEIVFTSPNFAFINSNGCVECNGCNDGVTYSIQGVEYVVASKNIIIDAIANNDDLSKYITSGIFDMSTLFYNNQTFNQDISNWDVSNVSDMSDMFLGARAFNQDIGNWDVGSVYNMHRMFYLALAFNQDIGSWDVRSCYDMNSLFLAAIVFNQDIGNWDVSGVVDMEYMFNEATAFNQDIGSWDVSSVHQMSGMFGLAKAFNQDIGSWDVSGVYNMAGMFGSAEAFNQDIGNWDVSLLQDMDGMFNRATNFNQDLTQWCVSNFTSMPTDFSTSSSLTASNHPVWGTCP